MDLINSLNIDLQLDVHENEARSISQSLCDERVLPALDKVLRRFEDEDIVIEEPLVIELGDVPVEQLSHAVEDAFYRALAKRRREAVTPYETTRQQVKKPLSEVSLEYLQFPVLPWDTDDVKQFDEQSMIFEMSRKAMSSDEYLERLTALVEGDIEACKRFFDLPWTKEDMVSVLQRMLPEIPALQGQVYSRLLRLLNDDREVKPSLTQEVFSYIMSGVLFGNRRDAVNREAIATLLVIAKEGRNLSQVQPEAMPSVMPGFKPITSAHAERQRASSQNEVPYYATMEKPAAKPKERHEASARVETNDAIVERREALKRGLSHDEGMRDRLLRLIHLVSLVLRGEASFSQCITELEAIVESLWEVVPLKREKAGNHFSDYPKTFSGGPAEAVLTGTTTVAASRRLDDSPSSEEPFAETANVVALERQKDSTSLEETSAATSTTNATRHIDGSPALAEASSETTTDVVSRREEGSPSSEEETIEKPIASASRRLDSTSPSEKSTAETTTAAPLSKPDEITSFEEVTDEIITATTLSRSDGPSSSLDTNLGKAAVSTMETLDDASSSKETSPESTTKATLRREAGNLSLEKASVETTASITSRQSGDSPSSEEASVEIADVSSSSRQAVSSSSKEALTEAATASSTSRPDGSSSLEEALAEAAAAATRSRQERASSTEEVLPEVANAVTLNGQRRMPSEKETPTKTDTAAMSKPLSGAPPSEKTTVEKGSASTTRHLDGAPSSEEASDENADVTPTRRSNSSVSDESFAETTPAAVGTESVSLSEEDVVDVLASLSTRQETELKRGLSQADKARLQEVVEAAIRKQPNIEKRIPVHNAGLVLLQPFLISFFDRLGLLESRKSFKSLESQLRAAHLLHELSGFGGEHLEHLLPLNKLLCGINIMFPIGTMFEATEEEKREVEALLKAVIRNWSAIGKVSPAGFQEAFIRREGLLERSQDEWVLRVESKGFDVLLDYIPWDIHTVSYPWNEYLIYVDWKV